MDTAASQLSHSSQTQPQPRVIDMCTDIVKVKHYKIFVLGTSKTRKSDYIFNLINGPNKMGTWTQAYDQPTKISFRSHFISSSASQIMLCECPGFISLDEAGPCLKGTNGFMVFVDSNDYKGCLEILLTLGGEWSELPVVLIYPAERDLQNVMNYQFKAYKSFETNYKENLESPLNYLISEINEARTTEAEEMERSRKEYEEDRKKYEEGKAKREKTLKEKENEKNISIVSEQDQEMNIMVQALKDIRSYQEDSHSEGVSNDKIEESSNKEKDVGHKKDFFGC